MSITVQWWSPGVHLEFPLHSIHVSASGAGVTLTKAEAFELLAQLRYVVEQEKSPPKESTE